MEIGNRTNSEPVTSTADGKKNMADLRQGIALIAAIRDAGFTVGSVELGRTPTQRVIRLPGIPANRIDDVEALSITLRDAGLFSTECYAAGAPHVHDTYLGGILLGDVIENQAPAA